MAISGLGREEDILVDEVVAQEAAAAQAHEEFHALEEILTVCHDPRCPASQPASQPCSCQKYVHSCQKYVHSSQTYVHSCPGWAGER